MRRLLAFAILAWLVSGCSTGLDLGSNDAGVPYDADCKPGTYTGNYSCTTATTSPLQFSGNGPITVTLVPAGADSLALTPDASLSSTSSGTTSTSMLAGVLDCATRKLTGTVSHVVFTSGTFDGFVTGSGAFSAVYEADAGTPALVDGVLKPPPTLAAMCTWTATLE
jgi:hypothetical protein